MQAARDPVGPKPEPGAVIPESIARTLPHRPKGIPLREWERKAKSNGPNLDGIAPAHAVTR